MPAVSRRRAASRNNIDGFISTRQTLEQDLQSRNETLRKLQEENEKVAKKIRAERRRKKRLELAVSIQLPNHVCFGRGSHTQRDQMLCFPKRRPSKDRRARDYL